MRDVWIYLYVQQNTNSSQYVYEAVIAILGFIDKYRIVEKSIVIFPLLKEIRKKITDVVFFFWTLTISTNVECGLWRHQLIKKSLRYNILLASAPRLLFVKSHQSHKKFKQYIYKLLFFTLVFHVIFSYTSFIFVYPQVVVVSSYSFDYYYTTLVCDIWLNVYCLKCLMSKHL